jgi:hypothetical protein
MGDKNTYWISMGEPKGKKPLGRLRRRWEDNIKCISEKQDGGMDWINLASG